MSGPKADSISITDERAEFERHRRRFSVVRAECARLENEIRELHSVGRELGADGLAEHQEMSSRLEEAQGELRLGSSSGPVATAERVLNETKACRDACRRALEGRKAELVEQYKRAGSHLAEADKERRAVLRMIDGFAARGGDCEEVRRQAEAYLAGNPLPGNPEFQLSRDGARRIEAAAREATAALGAAQNYRNQITGQLERQVVQRLAGDQEAREAQRKAFAERIRSLDPGSEQSSSGGGFDYQWEERFADIEAQIEKLAAAPETREEILGHVRRARACGEEAPRLLHYNTAQFAMSETLKAEKRKRTWQVEIRRLQDSFAPEAGHPAVDALLGELDELSSNTAQGDLDALRSKVSAAKSVAERDRAQRERSEAMIESLREMGYDLVENNTEAAGRWILQKQNDQSYGVLVMSNPQGEALQMQVVRLRQDDISDRERALRDKAREEEFCGDHRQFRESMLSRGFLMSEIKHTSPGLAPMPDLSLEQPSTAGKRGRQSKPAQQQMTRK